MLSELRKKSMNVEKVAQKALKDKKVISELLESIVSKKETRRFNSFKVLLLISQDHPEVLYPEWDFFAKLLNGDNTCHKDTAIFIIANLIKADAKNKFGKVFNRYY